MFEKIQRHRWGLTVAIELLYVFLYIGVAKVVKLLNESGYINNVMALIWVVIFLFVTFRLMFRIIRGFKQAILEGVYFEQGLDLESYIDTKKRIHFCDFSDDVQNFLLENYSFCMNRMTHEFYLVPLKGIQGKIIRIDNSPNITDVFEKSLYTYIDCKDSEQVREFCMKNPQALSFVTVVGNIKPNATIIHIDTVEDIMKLQEFLEKYKTEIGCVDTEPDSKSGESTDDNIRKEE